MSKVKLSVLITFYNQEEYVERALKSVFDQKTEFDYEVLIGDDCSNDSTPQIVQNWIDKYPEVISVYRVEEHHNSTDPGWLRASENRLNLLDHVRGEYFIFLDGDDYFSDNTKLQKQVEILDNTENRDCIACGHNIDLELPDGSLEPMGGGCSENRKCYPSEYWAKYYFHTDTLLVRSSVIESIPREILQHEFNDNLITYAIIQHGPIYFLNNTMAVYVQTQSGIWTEGVGSVKNDIRNIFLYDICRKINPDMKRETFRRCSTAWIRIFKNRKYIRKCELEPYICEANRIDLYYSKLWLDYENLNIIQKLCLFSIVAVARMRQKTGIW